jgi:hypothetical protein
LGRGDLNLGAGGEMGIYRRYFNKVSDPMEHWVVNKRFTMPMKLIIEFNGQTIMGYEPTAFQWWVTVFFRIKKEA